MMVVAVEADAACTAGTHRVLFEMPMPERVPGDPSRFIVSPARDEVNVRRVGILIQPVGGRLSGV